MKKQMFATRPPSLPFTLDESTAMMQEAIRLKNTRSLQILFHCLALDPSDPIDDRVPVNLAVDTVAYDLNTRFGSIDITVFNYDSSASVIVVKDGAKGYRNVLAGIGQATLHAVQLKEAQCGLTKIRRAVLWSATGNALVDLLLRKGCEDAGVIPMHWATIAETAEMFDTAMKETAAKIKAGLAVPS